VRKTVFVKYSQAFEALTLVATGKVTRFPIVLVGSSYWSGLLGWLRETVQAEGNIYDSELDLFTVTDDPTRSSRSSSRPTPRPASPRPARTPTAPDLTRGFFRWTSKC
jgi:predicted Rossmann-fold nucleotide-binding protein